MVLISWHQTLKRPVTENGGAVLEVNAAPGFRMHVEPSEGIPRNVAEPVIEMLYPKGHQRQDSHYCYYRHQWKNHYQKAYCTYLQSGRL